MGSNQSKEAQQPGMLENDIEQQPQHQRSNIRPSTSAQKRKVLGRLQIDDELTSQHKTSEGKFVMTANKNVKRSAYSAIKSITGKNRSNKPVRKDSSSTEEKGKLDNKNTSESKNTLSRSVKQNREIENIANNSTGPANSVTICFSNDNGKRQNSENQDKQDRRPELENAVVANSEHEERNDVAVTVTLPAGIQATDEPSSASRQNDLSKYGTEESSEQLESTDSISAKESKENYNQERVETNKDGVSHRISSSETAVASNQDSYTETSSGDSYSETIAEQVTDLPVPNFVGLTSSSSSSSGSFSFAEIGFHPANTTSYSFGSFTFSSTQSATGGNALGNVTASSCSNSSSVTLSSGSQSMNVSTDSVRNGYNNGNFLMTRNLATSNGSTSPNGSTSFVPSNGYALIGNPPSDPFQFTPNSASRPNHYALSFTRNNSSALDRNASAFTCGSSANRDLNWNEFGPEIEVDCPDDVLMGYGTQQSAIAGYVYDHFAHFNGNGYTSDRQFLTNGVNNSDLPEDFITIRKSEGDMSTKISSKNIKLMQAFGQDELTDENMGIILERPKYPRYATVASRIRSFDIWPETNKMSWEKLPEAGFVYTGTADCVRCFYCNGGLREWLKNDCPWTEHARYYPHCPHVRQCKGDEFVRTVQRKGTEIAAHNQDGEPGNEMDNDDDDDDDTEDILPRDQEAMRIAAEFVADRTQIERAAKYIKDILGKPSFDAQELVGVVYDIEEGKIDISVFEEGKTDKSDFAERKNDISDSESTLEENSDTDEDADGMDTRKVDRLETQEVESNNLEEENRMLKERSLCKVCLDATACVLFLECGHMVACPMCAPALANCPVCRAEVKGTLRAHFATDR